MPNFFSVLGQPPNPQSGSPRAGGFGLNYHRGFGGSSGPRGSTGLLEAIEQAGRTQNLTFEAGEAAKRQQAGIAGNLQAARIGAEANNLPHQLRQQRYNQVLPYLQGQLGTLSSSVGGANFGRSPISVGPVWSQDVINQNVNAARGKIDAETEGRNRSTQQSLAGRGFAPNSPLYHALQSQNQGRALASKADTERETRTGMADRNARHMLDTERARLEMENAQAEEDIARRRNVAGFQSALLGAIAGLV